MRSISLMLLFPQRIGEEADAKVSDRLTLIGVSMECGDWLIVRENKRLKRGKRYAADSSL